MWDFISVNEEAVRYQRVPVVEVAELQSDAVAVLETCVEEQGGIELELEQVTTQMLHVLFNYNVDYFSWGTKTFSHTELNFIKIKTNLKNCRFVKTLELQRLVCYYVYIL